jgi:hypothetical protein
MYVGQLLLLLHRMQVAPLAAAATAAAAAAAAAVTCSIWFGCFLERVEDNCVNGRFYQNAASNLAQPLQLQCKLQELCSDKISSILHVLQLSESSSAALDAGCSRD